MARPCELLNVVCGEPAAAVGFEQRLIALAKKPGITRELGASNRDALGPYERSRSR